MRTIDQLTKEDLKDIKVLCFDCDGVTVQEGTQIREQGNELIVKTYSISDHIVEKLNQLKERFFLVFSSGRSLLYLTRMYEKILWDRVALQGEVGLFTLYQGKVFQQEAFDSRLLEKSTRIKKALRELLKSDDNIISFEPKQLLVTIHCKKESKNVVEIIKRLDPEREYYYLWSGEAYDINPKKFNKGSGLEFLLKKMNLEMESVLAVGNDPNDREMVEGAAIGVTTDPQSVIKGADFITNQRGELGGEELINKLLELI